MKPQAIADAHSLEAAGDKILKPLVDGRLGAPGSPWSGLVALDGNLSTPMLEQISQGSLFDKADLRIAPASPGKAERLNTFLSHGRAMLYLNLEEANILCHQPHATTKNAALALIKRGVGRVIVTDGANPATEARSDQVISLTPPKVMVTRVTGAGDVFMASHIAAEISGQSDKEAFQSALSAAASYISSETPL